MRSNTILLSIVLFSVTCCPSQSRGDAKVNGLLHIGPGGGVAFSDGILNSALGITGSIGPVGPVGPVGPQGAQGAQGVTGPAGSVSVPLNLTGSLNSMGVINATNSSTSGSGVSAHATATTGSSYGVSARSSSNTGVGVSGWASAITGLNKGVFGQSDSTTGYGIHGFASTTTGVNYGVVGRSNSSTGTGVSGYAASTVGDNYGVVGISDSTTGVGVNGYASAITGNNTGVFGSTSSITGTGVLGRADATSGDTYGITGVSYSDVGNGVFGYAASTTGANAGVWGYTASPNGYAGYFSGNVYVSGDFSASGLKNFVQPHPEDPAKEIVYIAIEAPEAMIVHRGIAQLVSGRATIELPDYFRLVAHEQGIGIQVTPRSLSSKGLAAYDVSREQVKVGEMMEGTGSYEFDYIITGKRAGFESHAPIQANKHFSANGLHQAEFEKRHSGDNTSNSVVRNLLIRNGTMNSDGKMNKETAQRLGWKLNDSETGKR